MDVCSPHTRGDVPLPRLKSRLVRGFSPHAWGCSLGSCLPWQSQSVLPTRVGMFRKLNVANQHDLSSPHTRGDVPYSPATASRRNTFSPHAWGCSVERQAKRTGQVVLPTRVGMFRTKESSFRAAASSPHTRGDVPTRTASNAPPRSFSPHAWGCSGVGRLHGKRPPVLPTRVGMFRADDLLFPIRRRSPHTRGDVPLMTKNHG